MTGIAIVGMSCRFPGAGDLNEFWQMTVNAEPQFAGVPESRWDHSKYHRPGDFREPHSTYTDKVAFLPAVDQFAPSHYGVPPRRAKAMDPQQRLFVDLAREALQDAGWERGSFDRATTGVFAGVSSTDYRDATFARISSRLLVDGSFHAGEDDPELRAGLEEAAGSAVMPVGPFSIAGVIGNMVPAAVSEVFDLGGPSYAVDAACSSALVALDTAVRSLRSGGCSVALVGGVFVNLTPNALIGFSRAGALSRDGVCRPFDERADGFVLGEGGGVLVLRPLADALAAGDRVYAVVSGVGTANDGRGGGPMTPQAQGQLAALRAAYKDAGVAPGAIDLLEAHGTGTPVGDRTEMEAMRLLRDEAGRTWPCYVSSSKALIGHTLSAAGAAGLVRAALALHHGVVPPQPAEHRISPELRLDESGLRLTTTPQQWPQGEVRRAGVSSFGFGGTNVHAVLEGAPLPEPAPGQPAREDEPWLFLLSAGSVPQLARHARKIRDAVAASAAEPAAVARTLATRELLAARLSFVAATRQELLDRLDLAARRLAEGATGELAPGIHAAAKPLPEAERKVAFAFPGQGAQRPGMLADLVRRFPALARRAEELTALIAEESAELPAHLPGLLWAEHASDDDGAMAALTVTDLCQPALGISGVATAELLAACGVVPSLAVGHSVGEFPAAAAAGAIGADETVRFMARRGAALAAAVPAGTGVMLAVQTTHEKAEKLAADVDGVWPACYNHEHQVVFSGGEAAVERLREHCAERGVAAVRLQVSHAFHSPLVAAADKAVTHHIAALPLVAPARAFVSSVSGRGCDEPQEIRDLWGRHNSVPVRFSDAVTSVTDAGARFLVQIYGGDSLLRMARRTPAAEALDVVPLTTSGPDGARAFLTGLGRLAVAGVPVDPAPLFPADAPPLLSLPASPLETSSFSVLKRSSRKRTADARRAGAPAPAASAASVAEVPAAAPVVVRSASTTTVPIRSTVTHTSAAASASASTSSNGESSMSSLISFLHAQVNLLQSFGAAADGPVPNGASATVTAGAYPVLVPSAAVPTADAPAGPVAVVDAPAAPAVATAEAADVVTSRVVSAIAKISAYSEDFLQPGHVFATDLGFDSIMLAELAAGLRRQWPDIEVRTSDVVKISTVGELITTVQELLGTAPATPAPAPVEAPAVPSVPEPRAEAVPASDLTATGDVRVLPEVVATLERSRMYEHFGVRNPYYLPHEGTIRDVTRVEGTELISFSSYNYLGLSGHPTVVKAVTKAVKQYGSSVSAARILSGNRPLHEELDRGLARLVGAQDAVTLVSGHATNVTVIGHLVGPEDLILHDALAHDSIIQGCRLSGASRQPFPHNDIAALDRILHQVRDRYRRVLIVVEGVYSMDGDIADLPALIAVKQRHAALLMVDEAHSIGVMGKTGGGMGQHWGVDADDVDVWMGTLSKSLASCGGYVAGRHELIEHFRYTLPGFIYSAGLTPPNTAASLAALQVIQEEPERLDRLHQRSALFLRLSTAAGIDVGTSEGTPVVPCITGDSEKALKLADRLYQRGISANPILHPAVEERLARLRFFITSEHTEEQIEYTVKVMAEELAKLA
ncbi:type I polyketide synthase [Streptomyces sp. NBC_01669]|uniref:type I polyketide synthase n=1 Tax=Streptomyces sp. NBC_01669 TaxID=2975909 RepID=UPI0022598C44|nr:type I polyketide synthase [Streptomyces sp. NBC_01669]MCX4535218.1 aminotransferase class I/II-fold pyridoxal phosphate-dependent enzyme [Streptomyces sp. NBC_01669]